MMNMKPLEEIAKEYDFRKPLESESTQEYRIALANHVKDIDLTEAIEISSGKHFDDWTVKEKSELLFRAFNPNIDFDTIIDEDIN